MRKQIRKCGTRSKENCAIASPVAVTWRNSGALLFLWTKKNSSKNFFITKSIDLIVLNLFFISFLQIYQLNNSERESQWERSAVHSSKWPGPGWRLLLTQQFNTYSCWTTLRRITFLFQSFSFLPKHPGFTEQRRSRRLFVICHPNIGIDTTFCAVLCNFYW